MIKKECDFPGCSKIIEAYKETQAVHLMKIHQITHDKDRKGGEENVRKKEKGRFQES